MTNDRTTANPSATTDASITGRCYCGHSQVQTTAPPLAIAYCHCLDCRRFTGAPVAAFAAFGTGTVNFTPDEGRHVAVTPGVIRSFCPQCGSPIAARFDYLPGQIYVALGILDQADDLPPQMHAHAGARLTWLHIDDDLERVEASSRDRLLQRE